MILQLLEVYWKLHLKHILTMLQVCFNLICVCVILWCFLLKLIMFIVLGDESKSQWSSAVSILQPTVPRQPPTEEVLIANGHLLSLHGLLLLQLQSCRDIREETIILSSLTAWLNSIRPT